MFCAPSSLASSLFLLAADAASQSDGGIIRLKKTGRGRFCRLWNSQTGRCLSAGGFLFNLDALLVDPVDAFLFPGVGIEVNPVTVLSDAPDTLVSQDLFVLIVQDHRLFYGFHVKAFI